MIDTVWGSTDKPVSSKLLAKILSAADHVDGTLYIGYPIISTPEGSYPIDALLVSPTKGLVLFNVVEGKNLPDYVEAQDEGFNKMQAKLLQHQSLIQKRKLLVHIHTITFAPAVAKFHVGQDGDHLLCNDKNLITAINELENSAIDVFPALVSVIQAISTLRRGRKKRELHKANSRGTKIKTLEDSIANLDSQQSAAVVETFEGVQRIRGLAGMRKNDRLGTKSCILARETPRLDDWGDIQHTITKEAVRKFDYHVCT